MKIITLTLALLIPTVALAQQTRETFTDANGRVTGWATSNGKGGTYDASARNPGRSVTSNGVTTFYNNLGQQTGITKGR